MGSLGALKELFDAGGATPARKSSAAPPLEK
jgi:hypothetical protein